jgi:hypothetical protein
LPGSLTPQLQEQLTQLGTWMPFAPAAALLARFTGVHVSEATARRLTEVVGRAYEAEWQAEVEQLLEDLPPVPPGPARVVMSVDGAMVPLRGGEWGEVKTLVRGEVPPMAPENTPPAPAGGGGGVHGEALPEVRTTALSYCSRLADVEHFNDAVLLELHRRRGETAGQVAAVSDGAEWIQGFVDLHCPQAVRILDFAHAAPAGGRDRADARAQRSRLAGAAAPRPQAPRPRAAARRMPCPPGHPAAGAPRDGGGAGVLGQAPDAPAVSHLSGARLADWQRDRREWP